MGLIPHLLFLSFSFLLAVAQSTTSSSISATSTIINSTATQLPTNSATAISTNGTATTTISRGTATLSSSPTSSAAYPTLSGVSSCVVNCLTVSVAESNCSAITDTNCYCPRSVFRNTTVQCVSSECPSELPNAESLAQQFCNIVFETLTFPSPTVSGTTPLSATALPSGTTPANGAEEKWPSTAVLSGITALTMVVFGIW